MQPSEKPRVLCVDDEPNVLEGLSLHLRRRYAVATATSGAAALVQLARDPAPAVVISDMRMPVMDGAALLGRARDLAPDTVRMLLTGQADLASAIKAVNHGQLFRFLTKPCQPADLLAAVEAAVRQHELLTAERVLLEETLHGSIRALTEVLALTSPACFGRATRMKSQVSALARAAGLSERWQVEVAAMLSQLATITLPAETAERLCAGRPLSEPEARMVERLPEITERLLGAIPRLELVREILALHLRPNAGREASDAARRGAQVLRVVADLDALEAGGQPMARAFDTLRGRAGVYDADVLAAYAELRGSAPVEEIREVDVDGLRVGMVLAEEVRLKSGALLAARGFEVTEGFLARVRNFQGSLASASLRVVVAGAHDERSAA